MTAYKIRRTGQPPLKVEGKLIASANGCPGIGSKSKKVNRWYDLDIYRAANGRIVVSASFQTVWPGEIPQHVVTVVDGVADVAKALGKMKVNLDHRTEGYGFPPGKQFEAKETRRRANLLALWESRVSEVLETIGAEEVVDS